MKIKIEYDGKYPCLCMGNLIVYLDDKKYYFGKGNLHSGGSVYFTNDYQDEHVEQGDWSIDDGSWPKNFPKKYRQLVIDEINNQIPHGCCGGCL